MLACAALSGAAPAAALPEHRAETLTTEKTTMEEPGDNDAEGA